MNLQGGQECGAPGAIAATTLARMALLYYGLAEHPPHDGSFGRGLRTYSGAGRREKPMRSAQPPALLVVDDTPSIRQLLTHLLRDMTPHEVVVVADADSALQVLAARPVPLVIADYHLPDTSGDALALAVKARSPDTRVVIITADIEVESATQWPGVDRCLIKPFALRELRALVRTLLPGDTLQAHT